MAILHQATLRPSKLEMISEYLGAQPYVADGADFSLVGSYRFDDPAGTVGIETHLVSIGASALHLPLTYRAEPLANAEAWLLGVMDHSVLGQRWVYNGCGDPVYVTELARTMLTGGKQVEQFVDTPDGLVEREPTASVLGSGSELTSLPEVGVIRSEVDEGNALITAGAMTLVVKHVLNDRRPSDAQATLSGTWTGRDDPTILAFVP